MFCSCLIILLAVSPQLWKMLAPFSLYSCLLWSLDWVLKKSLSPQRSSVSLLLLSSQQLLDSVVVKWHPTSMTWSLCYKRPLSTPTLKLKRLVSHIIYVTAYCVIIVCSPCLSLVMFWTRRIHYLLPAVVAVSVYVVFICCTIGELQMQCNASRIHSSSIPSAVRVLGKAFVAVYDSPTL